MKKPFVIVLFILVLILSLGNTSISASSNPIKIAFLCDFSDVTKSYCIGAYNAASIALEEINKSGGLLGSRVILIKRDAGVDPQRHYDNFKSLVAREKVVAVFGGASSNCLVKASQASKETKIPYLISVGNSQTVLADDGHPFVFMFEASSWMETKGFSVFATLMPWKRFAWLGPDYLWGREVFGYFKQHFEEIGNPINWSTEAWHPLDTKYFSKQIEQILKAKPDALVIASWGGDMRRFVKQAQAYGLFDKLSAFGWFMSEETGLQLPEGLWTLTRASYSFLAAKYPRTRQFGLKFKKKYGVFPSGFPVCSYDSIIAWQAAVLKANSAKPHHTAKALKGLSFKGLRGESFIREIDGQMNASTFFGRLVYRSQQRMPDLDSIIEIPASKTWLTEKEVLERRRLKHHRVK